MRPVLQAGVQNNATPRHVTSCIMGAIGNGLLHVFVESKQLTLGRGFGVSVHIKRVSRLAVFVSILSSTGCGVSEYREAFVSRSPTRLAEIRLLRNFPQSAADYVFRIEISDGENTRVILTHDLESAVGMVEAHWNPEGDQVGLLVCEMFSGPIWLSYDFAHHLELPPATFRSAIEEQIRKRYSPPSDEDLIDWACSHQGNAAYQKMQVAH